MKRLLNILFWSVIAAAFIGPGTVTTAARAGSDFHFALAWALLFSVVACLVLQEASGRITVLTGKELGEAIRARFGGWVPMLVAAGIILGCAAYEAGNLLGGVAGMRLLVDVSPAVLTVITGVAAALLLATGNTRWIAGSLGALVALMGVAFVVTAVRLGPDIVDLLAGLLIPRIPVGSTILVLGLVGTTVVPYNLFLGSALARDSELGEMRWGLGVAVIGGGVISVGVLVVGTALGGGLEYERLAAVLDQRLGGGAGASLALGLFAAGFTSAITAPLAAALAARSLLGGADDAGWAHHCLHREVRHPASPRQGSRRRSSGRHWRPRRGSLRRRRSDEKWPTCPHPVPCPYPGNPSGWWAYHRSCHYYHFLNRFPRPRY